MILPDREHSYIEERYFAFGKSDKGRYILVVFTLRGEKQEHIRSIMSRDQNKKEKIYYEEHKNEVKKQK